MISTTIDTVIHYRHEAFETLELEQALIPMAEHLKAVATPQLRGRVRAILKGGYFRYREAQLMHQMILRAAKHAKANLDQYFPAMRAEVLINAQILENASGAYWQRFRAAQSESVPSL